MRVMGVDPGLDGAIAILDTSTGELTVHDMPTVELAKAKGSARVVSAQLLSTLMAGQSIEHAVVERVTAMPGQGVTGMFSLGRSLGIVEGIIAAYDVPITLVQPKLWQSIYGLKGKKIDADGSRQKALQLFPREAALFARKKDNGRADAALIARWYVHTHGWAIK